MYGANMRVIVSKNTQIIHDVVWEKKNPLWVQHNEAAIIYWTVFLVILNWFHFQTGYLCSQFDV